MPLLKFWKSERNEVLKMNLETIVKMAGDGLLKDGGETSIEFRSFLSEVEAEKLAEYATYCIENAFTNSGQILQDVINEIGRRIGFKAENGRYQGVKNDIGFDGIWSTDGFDLVIEVKTTDAYTIKLDVIAAYRDRLVEAGRIRKDSPILMVIGRNDTQSLEAQVRGSKHAWSMRIIGVDALIKLMEVNLTTSSDEVTQKIHTILQPIEYTRIDKIVDVIFTTAEDKQNEVDGLPEDQLVEKNESQSQDRTSNEVLQERKDNLIRRLSNLKNCQLVKRKHSLYSDQADSIHAVIVISKPYQRSESFYWYAYHNDPQRKFLGEAKEGFMLFGMTDTDYGFAIPYSLLELHWNDLYSTTKKNGKEYKHIFIYRTARGYSLRVGKVGTEIDLEKLKI
jgi:hypothetical protein